MSEWTDKMLATLRVLWGEGHSSAEIGRRMNISKNAVVGKAHRLNLPARPSPIRQMTEEERALRPAVPPKRTKGPTLAPLQSARDVVLPPPVTVAPRRSFTAKPCCWPIGEPGKPSFHFCNREVVSGDPYCEDHAAIAYVRSPGREKAA